MGAFLDGPWAGQQFSPPTPIDIASIERAIVARLQASVTSIEIVQFPDDPKSYRLTHRIGAALVVYRGAKYGDVADTAAIIQERKLEFEVTVLVRDLGWSVGGTPGGASPGAYAILESIRAALTGYQVPGARKIFMVREKFVERDAEGGVWIYLITIALTTLAVERSSSEDFPLFIKGIADDIGGETTLTVGATRFTFNSQDQIQLPYGNVTALTVSAIGGRRYSMGADYTLDRVSGNVTRIASGAIAQGASVNIAWSYADSVVATAGEPSPTF